MKTRWSSILAVCLCTVVACGTLLCGCSGNTPAKSSSAVTDKPALSTAWDSDLPGVYAGGTDGVDFVLNVAAGKEIQILQLTDLQVGNPKNARNRKRKKQLTETYYSDGNVDFEDKVAKYVKQLVAESNPDLIVLTGDVVFGETDDSGADFLRVIALMDSFQIPWAVTWGNHDNESEMGVTWQCEQLQNANYCVFTPGTVTGNSNYTIVLRQNGNIQYAVFLVDTNGCATQKNRGEGLRKRNVDYDKIHQAREICDDQIAWFRDSNRKIAALAGKDTVPNLVFQHIEPTEIYKAVQEQYGNAGQAELFKAGQGTDFGWMSDGFHPEWGVDQNGKFLQACKEAGTTAMFFGHQHGNDLSVTYEGIRLTFGSKTGTHSYYVSTLLGGTVATIDTAADTLSVHHIKTNI